MKNNYTEKEVECSLSGGICSEEHKDCNICIYIAREEAWQRIKCYIDCCNYDWTSGRIRHDYRKYYMSGGYCSFTLMDIINTHKQECELLFGGEY